MRPAFSMKRIFAFAALLATFGAASPLAFADDPAPATSAAPAAPAATPLSPEQTGAVISKVQAFYDQSGNFQADFTQKYVIKQYNKTKVSKGHVVFDKPGKMNWIYADPAGNWVKSDGKTLCVYEAPNNQLFQQAVNSSQYPAALAFLTGQGKLADVFDFTLFDGAQMSFPGGFVLVGKPKTATPAYKEVFFYVDKNTSQVRRVLIVDGQGNHNRFDFDAAIVNTKSLDQSQFACRIPPGANVIHP